MIDRYVHGPSPLNIFDSILAMVLQVSSAATVKCRIDKAVTGCLKKACYLFLDVTKDMCGKKWKNCRW